MDNNINSHSSEPHTEKPEKKQRLTDRQKLFIEYYVKTLNATEAARKAGYSESSARFQGHKLITNPYIRELVDEALNQRVEECRVDTDLIIGSLKEIALSPSILPKDRVKALDLLGRYQGLWSGDAGKSTPTTFKVVLKDGDD